MLTLLRVRRAARLRRRPALDVLGGQGLWVVNQVCDLVELRSGRTGTTVRLQMRLHPA